MKRKTLLAAVTVLTALLLFGCSLNQNKENTIKDNKKLAVVIDHVNTVFNEKYGATGTGAVTMPVMMEKTDFYSTFALKREDFSDYYGLSSISMTNSDRLVSVRCKEGRTEAVSGAFEKYRKDLMNQYEFYRVGGSYERAKAGKVYVKGDYVFLLVLGVGKGADGAYDFEGDLQMAVTAIDSMFN